MKFNIKPIQKTLFVTALLVSGACSDFLEEKDPSNIAPNTFFTEPEHAEVAVNGIYENLRFHGAGAGIFSANFQMLDAFSGTAETETGQNSDLNNLYSFQHTGDNLHLTQWWRELYEGIGNANLAIKRIPEIPAIEEDDLKKWVGHARFLRAFHYFWLVRLWGDVPLLTEPIASWTSPEVTPNRAPKEDVYALIEQDLLYAEGAGFPMMDASGRASLAAVKSMLARLYLTMAGYPLNRGKEYYDKAAAKAKEVIDYANGHPKEIHLFRTYDSLHIIATENRAEHIFGIQYAAGVANNEYQAYFLPNNTNITASGEVGTTVPTKSFLATFETNDIRRGKQGDSREAWRDKQFFFRQYYKDGNGDTVDLAKSYVYKHFDVIANGTHGTAGTGQADLNYPIVRYADVLLMFAEAQNASTGPSIDVENALNAVRSRAGLPAVTGVSQSQMQEAIWRERWHELCYEGITWFDMQRLHKVYNETNNTFVEFEGATLSTGVVLQKKHLLLPLPANDYRNNTNLRPNNDGW